jgi:hypothetical protein
MGSAEKTPCACEGNTVHSFEWLCHANVALRILSASLVLVLVFTAGCTGTKQMTTLPQAVAASAAAHPSGTVVLFRLAIDEGGNAVPAPLSARPRGRWYFRVDVAPDQEPLDGSRIFPAGQLDRVSSDGGWGFLILPTGSYRLAYSALRTKFSMAGARERFWGEAGRHLSSRSARRRESATSGTFALSCHRIDRWFGYTEHECTASRCAVKSEQAGQIASTLLSRFEPMQVDLAAAASPVGR